MKTLQDDSANDSGTAFSPRAQDDRDLSPILQLVTWLLLAVTSLMFLFRLLTRFFIKAEKSFSLEDALISLAFLFGLGESISLVLPQSKFFGKDIGEVSLYELQNGLKADYAAEILFQLGLNLSKLSVCQGFLFLSPDRNHRLMIFVLIIAIIGILLSSLFGTAFQCGTHTPWEYDSSHCISLETFRMFEGIANIITDSALIVVSVIIFFPLKKMALRTRLIIIGFYASRILVIATTILQVIWVPLLRDPNFTLRAFPYYISRQFTQFTSITSACVVYFWPFLQSIQSGLLGLHTASQGSQHPLADPFHGRSSDCEVAERQQTSIGAISLRNSRDV
ncbi:hypothetical protein F5Y10DRAFT_236059 [Nemania abortiva]|nr:hypothetical protein F5Y10DRAFT_236059 [Nemania abortiva]